MKNRGFTLIELMAIIIITSTIGILSYASLSSTIKNNKLRETSTFENSLISAAKLYMLASQENYSDMENEDFDTRILCREMIENKYKKDNDIAIFFVMGADNFIKLPNWKNAKELITKYQYIIFERNNSNLRSQIEENELLNTG